MKLFELRRLNTGLAGKLTLSYIGKKLLHKKLVNGQEELISYFYYLSKLNIHHKKTINSKYYLVESPQYGEFYLRQPPSSDYKVFEQVFVEKEYLKVAEMILQYCKNVTISVIDGGANIGFTTIFLHHLLKGKKKPKFILVEPFEDNISSVKLNIRAQGVEQVFVEKAGLYNKSCFLKIDTSFRDGMEWSVQILESDEPTDLKSIEIKDIVSKYELETIDLLKLDIEGAEKFLFEDEAYANSFLEKVNIIAIELHDEYDIALRILDILKKNNFELSRYGEMNIGIKNHLINPGS